MIFRVYVKWQKKKAMDISLSKQTFKPGPQLTIILVPLQGQTAHFIQEPQNLTLFPETPNFGISDHCSCK